MKHIQKLVGPMLMFVVILFGSCKKEKLCEGCQTTAPINKPNVPPVAYAGLDQTIELPKDSVTLYGTASHDPDGKITKWKWTKIIGPSPFNIVNADAAMAKATNLVEGVYQFELTVTDSLGLSSKDTTTITVYGFLGNEKIFSNQTWECWWGCWIDIPDFYSHVPAGVFFRVYIKRDFNNIWVEVPPIQPTSMDYGFAIDNGHLIIMGPESGSADMDTPDIKVTY